MQTNELISGRNEHIEGSKVKRHKIPISHYFTIKIRNKLKFMAFLLNGFDDRLLKCELKSFP